MAEAFLGNAEVVRNVGVRRVALLSRLKHALGILVLLQRNGQPSGSNRKRLAHRITFETLPVCREREDRRTIQLLIPPELQPVVFRPVCRLGKVDWRLRACLNIFDGIPIEYTVRVRKQGKPGLILQLECDLGRAVVERDGMRPGFFRRQIGGFAPEYGFAPA